MNELRPLEHASGTDQKSQRLLALIGAINGVVVEVDGDGRYLNVWADDLTMLRVDPVTSIGRTLVEVLGEVSGRPLMQIVRRVFETGESEAAEWSIKGRNRTRWMLGDFKRVRSGGTYTVLCFARDISERREAEERLRQLEERYRLAGEATNDLLYDWDVVGDSTTFGRNVNRFLGLPPKSIETAGHWVRRIPPEDYQRVIAEIERAFASGDTTRTTRYRIQHADGTYIELLDRGTLLRDESGKPLRMVGSLTDVTQINRLQAQLVQSDRMAAIGALAAGVGHEINNPLSYVLGNIEYALDVGPLDDETRTALEEAREGAKRIAEIVRSLKLFSTDRVEVSDVHIESMLEQSIKLADNQIRHRARLVRDFQAVPNVSVNEGQLGQVCLNLLINAAQGISDGKKEQNEICISTRVDARKRVVIAVSDTGAGIAPEHLGKVFEPFGQSTGIGLAVCRSIVQSMGGEISVTSTPGERTTFEVALPTTVVTAPPPPVAVKPKMLVIDDDLAVGRYIARALKSECDVTTVGSSECALAQLDAGNVFDVVLCDMMMPEMNGVELYEVLRERHAAVLPRMFFMSGGAFTPETARFLESIPDRTLEKPIDKDRLRALLNP